MIRLLFVVAILAVGMRVALAVADKMHTKEDKETARSLNITVRELRRQRAADDKAPK